MEDDVFKYLDEDCEYSYKYAMARVANALDEISSLSDYFQESDFCKDMGLDKFKECSSEVEKVKEQIENLYGAIIDTYLNNKLMTPIE